MKSFKQNSKIEPQLLEKLDLSKLALNMKKAGFSKELIELALQKATNCLEMLKLLISWNQNHTKAETEALLKQLQFFVGQENSYVQNEFICIPINNLKIISHYIRPFKDAILEIVMDRGGIKQLAEKTKITQPSLSRFFNSNTMPRRATLLKIARALEIHEVKVTLLE